MDRYICSSLIALILSISALTQLASQNEHTGHLVEVGPHKMFLNCTGTARSATVILETGTGDTSEVWSAVQKQVQQFATVCSYDRLGLGKSDKVPVERTADEIVSDLHELLHTVSVAQPYVMVGHSIGGIYVRKYAALYPEEVTALVLVDSAHEEQFVRVAQISPEWARRIHSQFPPEAQRSHGFLPDQRLTWHFDKPLIVIEHVAMPASDMPDTMARQSEAVFHDLQKDLASRSKFGQLREAQLSGHYIQRDQPELVTQAIRDVIRESATPVRERPKQ